MKAMYHQICTLCDQTIASGGMGAFIKWPLIPDDRQPKHRTMLLCSRCMQRTVALWDRLTKRGKE
jgi:hypothetical protein